MSSATAKRHDDATAGTQQLVIRSLERALGQLDTTRFVEQDHVTLLIIVNFTLLSDVDERAR